MKPFNGFIVSIFLLLLITPFSTQAQQKECRKADLTVEITDARDGKDGAIKVSSKDTRATFTIHLMGRNGRGRKDDQLNVTTGAIENIKPGKYELVIYYEDPDYCSETRKVTVN